MSESQNDWFTLRWSESGVQLLDQRKLPAKEEYLTLTSVETVAEAIECLAIRGAPAIGCAAAMGVALGAARSTASGVEALRDELLAEVFPRLSRTRPTAVNLFWALDRMRGALDELVAQNSSDVASVRQGLIERAEVLLTEDQGICRKLGSVGATLLRDGDRVLTHCNAGALATGGYGTALGVVRAACEAGKQISVLADETRPLFQGARLTAWELQRDGIPVEVCTDSMSGYLMQRGEVDVVIVGADRIAANGDTANKIGTYSVAVLAREHGIPFYVAAPLSTIDRTLADGESIPIEERGRDEVAHIGDRCILPDGIGVRQPAFDMTPARFITALITEAGLVRPPSADGIDRLFR